MNAIVPLNITAIRVNENDSTNLVSQFKGRTAAFEKMPHGSNAVEPSTGAQIILPLDDQTTPANELGTGIHLHWSLPDYFRHGVQPAQGGEITFPHAPNRWIVTRLLRIYDQKTKSYGPVETKSWVVESDYISDQLQTDPYGVIRPAISVPLPSNPTNSDVPYRYMGQIVEYEKWDPASEPASSYLPSYKGTNGKNLYLTAIGFVGPSFASYYPECASVFGFWDHFKDIPAIAQKIAISDSLQFKVSYQVAGWIDDSKTDPLNGLSQRVATEYDNYVRASHQQKVEVKYTPTDIFESISQEHYRWAFTQEEITYTLNADETLKSIDLPSRTLCAGVMQEVVWDMLTNPSTTYFLNNPNAPNGPSAVWSDEVQLGVGNTTVEALSTLLKEDLSSSTDQADVDQYETLLDALQLGLLGDTQKNGNTLITLEESLHTQAFAKVTGGYSWVVEQRQQEGAKAPENKRTLPLRIAEHLHLLNQAQKNYDQARAALDTMRKQLFMDWFRFIEIYITGKGSENVTLNALTSFLQTSSGGELNAVIDFGNTTGILSYEQNPDSGEITGLNKPTGTTSLAAEVWQQYRAILTIIANEPEWEVKAHPSSPFWLPTDPVVVMEGKRIEPARRNGTGAITTVRTSQELIDTLDFTYKTSHFTVKASGLNNIPAITSATPMQEDIQAVLNENYLLIPSLNEQIAEALKAIGGNENPAVSDFPNFLTTLSLTQGGLSPIEGTPDTGLFGETHTERPPSANPTIQLDSPLALKTTFTNSTKNAHTPSGVAWNAQSALPEFSQKRFDPFIPVFLVWTFKLDPLIRSNGNDYSSDNLTDFFELDPESIDYDYKMPGGQAAPFTLNQDLNYSKSTTLSRQATRTIQQQIDTYIQHFPDDTNGNTQLEQASKIYGSRNILSQGFSGFNIGQTLRNAIAQVPVKDLIKGSRDAITTAINAAAIANPEDNWYQFGFNSLNPIATGPLAIHNFGPLRSGFADIQKLDIIDAFGQSMTLSTKAINPNGSLQTNVAQSLRPRRVDLANKDKIFLPPRLLTPSRLWFKWLSATHDNHVDGVSSDFVEMNSHSSTSPVFGWIIPNHLDNSFFFYDANGRAIGAFGIEHGTLKYRTRAGNMQNSRDLLEDDIGPKNGSPLINPHLAKIMWYFNGQDADFIGSLMSATLGASKFCCPTRFAQNTSLAVLMGNPLALTRAVLGLESEGAVLPVSQADTTENHPFADDVNNNHFEYFERQKASSAALGEVQFPLRLGNLANIDDGLVGFLIEKPGSEPYSTLYSPTASPSSRSPKIKQPDPDTIELTLNHSPEIITMFVDPRAPIHATTGILPVNALEIPPAQYEETLQQLSITFFTHPILERRQDLIIPLPQEAGYQWSWVNPGDEPSIPLPSEAGNELAIYDYTPQKAIEGWIRLDPAQK